MVKPDDLVEKFRAALNESEVDQGKRDALIALLKLFGSFHSNKEFESLYPEFPSLYSKLLKDLDRSDPEIVEDDLALLYAYLHGKDSAYSPEDRKEFDTYGGYWCHAGGLSPLFRAGPYITPETRLADYGAGNGLQGLLFQYLYPHQKTCQIELSSGMIQSGRKLQSLMKIPEQRVEWLHKNVIDVSPRDFDFIYIYRPVRPEGKGRKFYESFAEALDQVRHRVTIFSIADCLKDFLSHRFHIFHDDGHLTCFTNE